MLEVVEVRDIALGTMAAHEDPGDELVAVLIKAFGHGQVVGVTGGGDADLMGADASVASVGLPGQPVGGGTGELTDTVVMAS